MTERVSSDKCVIQWCRVSRRLNSYFCTEHEEKWMESPERGRAKDIDTATHTLSMLADFVTRRNGEGL
jgi:hypothetical protein